MLSHGVMRRKRLSPGASTYEKLTAAQRPGERLDDVVDRLLVGTKPSFNVLEGLLDKHAGAALSKAFDKLRAADLGT